MTAAFSPVQRTTTGIGHRVKKNQKLLNCTKVCCVCVLPSHLFWTSGLWTYQPGSHRRKVTQDFSTFLLRCLLYFFSREGFSHSFPSLFYFIFSERAARGGGALTDFFFFIFFPVQQTHEQDWPPCKVVFRLTNTLNVRSNSVKSNFNCSQFLFLFFL